MHVLLGFVTVAARAVASLNTPPPSPHQREGARGVYSDDCVQPASAGGQ